MIIVVINMCIIYDAGKDGGIRPSHVCLQLDSRLF